MRVLQHDGYPRSLTRLLFLLVAGSFFALSACASKRGGPIPYEPTNFGRPDAESIAPQEQGPARIGALDKVRVNVFQVAELSGEFRVDSGGSIDFPLIGSVRAGGLTEEELRRELARRLGEKYLRDPNVQVALTEQTPQSVTVDGSVRDPGVFVVKGSTTLMKAVAMAKGTAEDANPRRVYIFRTIKGERMAGAFDLADIRRGAAVDPPIYGNDIIIVDGSSQKKFVKDLLSSVPLLSVLRPF
jgi:polysaccharide export outer membrane protein